ncbi:hypothetical protein Ae201684_004024 [Aphanomyces euteiches]|uniref:Uncharacterized protein n=1 Tax=Aphanomyces euteiches TaxID=100861 RepID=A0A6G0XK14_9STRA|nr:hypothetical protein Ae201684_004024 [Aphanomyces euteiches]
MLRALLVLQPSQTYCSAAVEIRCYPQLICSRQHSILLVLPKVSYCELTVAVAERGHVDVVQVLLQHTDMDLVACVDRSGATAIQIAQLANQTVVFELLHLRMGDSVLHDRMLDHLLVSASSS